MHLRNVYPKEIIIKKGEKKMSIERAIEKMNRDTRDYVKDLSAAYKKTGDLKYVSELLKIIQNHGERATESEIKSFFR